MSKEVTFRVKMVVDGKEQFVSLTTSAKDLCNVVDGAKNKAAKFRDTLLRYNQAVLVMQNLTSAVSQLSGVLNGVTAESRSFSAAMKAANTMAGKSGDDFERLKDQTANLAKTIPIARDALANGLYQVISNGVPEDNWISYLEASAKSSIGGIADLGEVVKVTSTVIKNYGLEWSAAKDIQDKIQLTAKNGVTSFEQLAAALPSVTGQAAQLGVSFTEMLAVMSTLTGVTGNTAEVATQLTSVLTALTKESSKSQNMAKEMGIEFNAASIKAAGGLRNYLQELDKTVTAYSERTGQLRESIYSKLFGRAEALRLVNGLTGQMAQKFDENIAALDNSAGTMERTYSDMASTGSAKLKEMQNSWAQYTDYIASTVSGILPYLNFASQFAMTTTSVLTLRKAFVEFNVVLKLVRVSWLRYIAAHALFPANARKAAAAINVMSQAFRSATTRAIAMKIAIRGLLITSGVGIAIAALGTVINALVGSMENAKSEAEGTADGIEGLDKSADAVKEAYDSTLSSTFSQLMGKYSELKKAWQELKTEHEKTAWIRDNQDAFSSLKIEISSLSDAESIFSSNTNAVVEAFTRRAKAAARMAQLTALYSKQIEADNSYTDAQQSAQQQMMASSQHARAGSTIPQGSYRNVNYGYVDKNHQWRFSEEGAMRYSGVDAATAKAIRDAAKEREDVAKQIQQAERQYAAESAEASHAVVRAPRKQQVPSGSGSTTVPEQPAVEGSIDWYQKNLDELRKKIYATGDEAQAQALQKEYKAVEAELKGHKVKIGLEAPDRTEAKTYVETLRSQLAEAEKDVESAVTVEARLEAVARVGDLQAQINEATGGRLTIAADVQPTYITHGSVEDKRQSYSNAQSKAKRIRQDVQIGIIGKDEAMSQLAEINRTLDSLNLNHVDIDIDTDDIDKAKGKYKDAADSIGKMGSAFSGLGETLELPALNVAGTIAQAIATMAEGYASATASAGKMGPWAWIAFAAAGLAQLAAMVASVKNLTAFADGGVVSGPTMALVGEYAGARNNPEVIAPLDKLRSIIGTPDGSTGGNVTFRIEGRTLAGVLEKEYNHRRRM